MDDDPMAQANEKLQGYMTLALTVAARVVEVYAARRQKQAEDARRQSEAFARQVEAQQRTEAVAARYQLRAAGSPEWWNKATPEQAAAAYATARAYGQVDPELAGMAQFMAGEIERRYGIDPNELVVREEQRAADIRERAAAEAQLAGQEQATAAAAAREAEQIEAEIVRHVDVLDKLPPELRAEFADVAAGAGAATGGLQGLIDAQAAGMPSVEELIADPSERQARTRQAQVETAEATALMAEANTVDAAVRADGKVDAHEATHEVPQALDAWDAAVRHEKLADRLEHPGMPQDAARARLAADALQGRPAAEAPAAGHSATRSTKPSPSRGRGMERTRTR